MFDVMTRLKIHNMAEGQTPQAEIAARCGTSLRSVERILTEDRPTRGEVIAGHRVGARRQGRPPKADEGMVARIRLLLESPGNERLPATEVHRRAAEWGYAGGRSQLSELVKRLRPAPRKEPVIRFEGLPGEYAQFDFGECLVEFCGAGKERVQFFAARLKYSRFMHVVVVPDQTAETLARSVIASLVAFGGSPREWVFDNPRTVRISPIGASPVVLHRCLRQLVAEYNVIATLCSPRSGNQKGSVERLVGFVKNSFLRLRRFRDLADLQEQLSAWLQEVNHRRPSDATKVVPAVAREDEARWLRERPVQVAPELWAIEDSATVTPMGTISYKGTTYSATARHLGAPATVLARAATLEIVVAGQHSTHAREDGTNEVRRLPEHRLEVLGALHGARKVATFRRQCLLELGAPAWQFMGPLVHRCPDGRWARPCHELFDLLTEYGDGAMRDAFTRCVARGTFDVAAVRAVLREAA